jgi:hypothetical protein
MPRHNTVVIEFQGNTGAANTPLNLGAMGNVGGYITGVILSYCNLGAIAVPNQMRLQYGGAAAPAPAAGIILGFLPSPATQGWAITSGLTADFPSGIPITAATNNIWVTAVHSANVWMVANVTIWLI